MSRIINSDSPAQNRNRLLKLVSSAVIILIKDQPTEKERNDLIAFIILSLKEIEKTITLTTAPWEKREYWVKADQFRNEWKWVNEIKTKLMQSRTSNGWQNEPVEIRELEGKTAAYKPTKRIEGKEFWKGAYSVLLGKK